MSWERNGEKTSFMVEKDDGKDGVTIDQFFKGASQRAISFSQTDIVVLGVSFLFALCVSCDMCIASC